MKKLRIYQNEDSAKRVELYNQILIIVAEYFKKDVPSNLEDSLSRGPGTKYPVILCCFLMVLQELTSRGLVSILEQYGIDKTNAATAIRKWNKYYDECPYLKTDIAMICLWVREKYCNNNAPYE